LLSGQVPPCEDAFVPVVDLPSKFVRQVRLRLSRNIRPYPFVSILRRESLIEIQSYLAKHVESKVPNWDFINLDGLEKEERDELVETRGVWIPEVS